MLAPMSLAGAPRALPREHTRRHGPPLYRPEWVCAETARARRLETAPELIESLARAGAVGSAQRRALRDRAIDPKLARLVLLFYGRGMLRAADVAWRLNVSPSTASRHLDRAERAGLIDKFYMPLDRRGTWARLTERGRALRLEVEAALASVPTHQRPRGEAYGVRTWRGREEL
jgi:DNA-binding MarR family transcriptional regulator